jgi:hypothetical protein
MGNLYTETGSTTPDNLVIGANVPILVKGLTIVAGQGVLVRGSVIGVITAGGKGKLVAKASVDGSQVAKFILADNVDTTAADVVAQVYESGEFNRKALVFAAANTAADHEDSLRSYGIFLNDSIAY